MGSARSGLTSPHSAHSPQPHKISTNERKFLPLLVGAETTSAVAATWFSLSSAAFVETHLVRANTLPTKAGAARRISHTRLELRLRLIPGGERTIRVRVLKTRYRSAPQPGLASDWFVSLALRRSKVTDMTVSNSRGTNHELRLKLWTKTSAQPVRTMTRPVGPTVGRFHLRWLDRGTYLWALSDGRQVVGTGSLRQPCPDSRAASPSEGERASSDSVSPSACAAPQPSVP